MHVLFGELHLYQSHFLHQIHISSHRMPWNWGSEGCMDMPSAGLSYRSLNAIVAQHQTCHLRVNTTFELQNTGLFISPSGISELDCATTKTDTVERSISIGRESLHVFFVLGALAYFQIPPLGVVVKKNGVHSE